jgi:hypothetical protein
MECEDQVREKLGVPFSHIIIAYEATHPSSDPFSMFTIFDAKRFGKIIMKL